MKGRASLSSHQRTNSGFSALNVVLIIIIIVVLAAIGFLLFQRLHNDDHSVKHATADVPAGWKAYTSPVTGFTISYPSNWITLATDQKTMTATDGLKESFLNLYSPRPAGSNGKDGTNSNVYACVSIGDYAGDTSSLSGYSPDKTLLTVVGSISPNSSTKLNLETMVDGHNPTMSIFDKLYTTTPAHNTFVPIGNNGEFQASVSFNCRSNDNTSKALASTTGNFLDQPQIKQAIQILQTLRY